MKIKEQRGIELLETWDKIAPFFDYSHPFIDRQIDEIQVILPSPFVSIDKVS